MTEAILPHLRLNGYRRWNGQGTCFLITGRISTPKMGLRRNSIPPGPSAKRSKIQPSVSFAEITKDRVRLGLIDKGNPERRIPRIKWKAVESQLSLICLRMVREKPGTSPCCLDAGWYKGSVKVVACDSQRSADLYKQATSKLSEVYEGANIVALDWCDVPSRSELGLRSQQRSRCRRTSSTCCRNANRTSLESRQGGGA